jgi:hypothetical protein
MKGAAKDARGAVNEARGTRDARARDTRERALPPRQAPRRPKWPVPLALLGLLAIVSAVILAVTTNNRRQLPTDLDTTRQLTGTANTLLNQQALQSGDFGNAIATNVPVTGERTVRVVETDGDNALVTDERTLATGGTQIGSASDNYAVNRRSLEAASGAPSSWSAEPHQGLAVGFPIGVEQRDYSGWVSDTQATTPIRYLREEARGGVNTYVFQTDVAAAPIRNQAVLSSLPSNLSRTALQGIAPSLSLPPDELAALNQALPGLPDQVPLTYTFQGAATYWVEPTTGQIIDTQRQEARNAVIGGPGGSTLANMPVYDLDSRFTEDSVAAAGREAADRRDSLNTSGRVWPWVLGTLGALALLAGLLGLMARRRTQRVPPMPEPSARPAEPTRRPTTGATTGTGRRAEETDTARRLRESQHGQPQTPYAGQTPHAGPYRESRAGEAGAQPEPRVGPPPPDEEQFPTRGQPGQYPGGNQPPRGGG